MPQQSFKKHRTNNPPIPIPAHLAHQPTLVLSDPHRPSIFRLANHLIPLDLSAREIEACGDDIELFGQKGKIGHVVDGESAGSSLDGKVDRGNLGGAGAGFY